MAHTDEIAHRLASALSSEFPDFRYTRSKTQFRKIGAEYADDLIIDVTSCGGESYTVAFYLGVAHISTEKLIAELETRKASSYDRSVFQYSVNQKNFDLLGFKKNAWWSGLDRDTDFSGILNEVRDFVRDCVFPYFEHFHDVHTLRESLVRRDELILNHQSFKQVLAIDVLLDDLAHLQNYRKLLQEEVNGGYRHDCQAFTDFHGLIAGRFPHLFTPFTLQPNQNA